MAHKCLFGYNVKFILKGFPGSSSCLCLHFHILPNARPILLFPTMESSPSSHFRFCQLSKFFLPVEFSWYFHFYVSPFSDTFIVLPLSLISHMSFSITTYCTFTSNILIWPQHIGHAYANMLLNELISQHLLIMTSTATNTTY